jgi:hypothetical protein
MQQMHPLGYQSKKRRPRSIALPVVLLVVVSGMIWALHELAIMPYRPPYDMSTFLGGPEEEFVSALIAVLAVVWIVILFWCVACFRRRKDAT